MRPAALICLCIALAVPGCQSAGPGLIRDSSGPFVSNNAALRSVSAEGEVSEARRLLRAGEHAQVILRLTGVTAQYAGTDAANEAWYLLGQAYYEIDGFYDAERYFQKYLELAPEGPYAALAREYVAGIQRISREREAARAALEARVAKYDGVDAPEELAASLELADSYWKNGEFEKAGVVYARVLETWPSLKDDATVRRRMEPDPKGGFRVLTPVEFDRRHSNAEPLSVFNVQSFRSGRFQAEHSYFGVEYYNVSGQVANRGEFPVGGAAVMVTIYGLGGQVFDTQTVQLGRIGPGEIRAFSVRFNNFDNIENVHRHECIATYTQ